MLVHSSNYCALDTCIIFYITGGKVYWVDTVQDAFYSMDLDGGNRETLYTYTQSSPARTFPNILLLDGYLYTPDTTVR